MFTLRLRRLWDGADAPGGFFEKLLVEAIAEPVRVTTSQRGAADLEIVEGSPRLHSLIGGRLRSRLLRPRARDARWADQTVVSPQHRRSLWFTAENVRPPFVGDWSGFLSFDLDSLGGRNAYLPLWLLDLSDFNALGDISLDKLSSRRRPDLERPGFMCAFIGNPDPMRFHAIRALSELGPVEVFGRAVGRPVQSKWPIARNFQFILSFENDVYPGYVTEKALDGARSGAVPIYRGSHPCHFNQAAMVASTATVDFQDLVSYVAAIREDRNARAALLEAPILESRPSLTDAVDLIRRVLDE